MCTLQRRGRAPDCSPAGLIRASLRSDNPNRYCIVCVKVDQRKGTREPASRIWSHSAWGRRIKPSTLQSLSFYIPPAPHAPLNIYFFPPVDGYRPCIQHGSQLNIIYRPSLDSKLFCVVMTLLMRINVTKLRYVLVC